MQVDYSCSNISPKSSFTRFRASTSALRPGRGCAIHPTYAPVVLRRAGPQQSLPFHAVQNRVERAGAQPIAVPAQLVDHLLAEDWTFSGVMEKMEPDEPGVEVSIYHRISITDCDNENRGYCAVYSLSNPFEGRMGNSRNPANRTGWFRGMPSA